MGYFVEHYFAKQGWHNHVMGRLQLRYIHPRGQTYKGRNDMGAHILGANQPRGLTNKGRNIQEFPVRDSPVRDAITLHPQQSLTAPQQLPAIPQQLLAAPQQSLTAPQ
jgi:hypothetical protein